MIFAKVTMNNTKVAIVWTDKRSAEYYFNPNWAVKLTRYFPKNYEFAFFALTDTNSAVYREKENYTIWFKPDTKTLNYGINVFFEPDILIVIGTSTFNFESILGNQKKKIFIHKGNIHRAKDAGLFDAVIVETEEDKKHYKNAVVQPVVDEENFNDLNVFKFFSVCYPQEISLDNFEFFSKVRLFGSISNTLSTTVQLPLYRTDILNLIINQSRVVGLFDEFDSFEIALASLSCNVPVVSLENIKSSQIPAVIKAKNDVQDFVKQTLSAVDYNYNYREDYILPNFTVKHMANTVKALL
jgi:hypothetical protein